MAPAAQLARGAPPHRMPKLAYRNPLPADQASLSSADTSTSDTPSNEPHPDLRLSTPSSAGTSFLSLDSQSLPSPSLASSDASLPTSSTSAKKKKAGTVLGFLTLKEPSQSAFEQFAEQQRKQQAEKGGKITPTGLNGISPQKLPGQIPKVNSKWDGLPEAKRNRDSVASSRKRDSTLSAGLSTGQSRRSAALRISTHTVALNGSRGPPNSFSSASGSSPSLPRSPAINALGERRDSGPTVSSSEKSMSSPSTTTLPEITYFFPDNPNSNDALPDLSHGSIDKHRSLALSSLSGSSNAGATHTHPDASNSRTNTMSGGQASHHTDIDFRAVLKRASGTTGFLAGEAQEVHFPDDGSSIITKGEEEPVGMPDERKEEEETEGPALFEQVTAITTPIASPLPSPLPSPSLGGGFPRLGPMNFSRPLSSQTLTPVPDVSRLSVNTIVNRAGVTELPTLYEASTASSSNATINHLSDSRSRKGSDAASLASSVTPSEMSASWYRTSRERLGLGGRIRKNDILPWDPSQENVPGKKKKGPLSMFAR